MGTYSYRRRLTLKEQLPAVGAAAAAAGAVFYLARLLLQRTPVEDPVPLVEGTGPVPARPRAGRPRGAR